MKIDIDKLSDGCGSETAQYTVDTHKDKPAGESRRGRERGQK